MFESLENFADQKIFDGYKTVRVDISDGGYDYDFLQPILIQMTICTTALP